MLKIIAARADSRPSGMVSQPVSAMSAAARSEKRMLFLMLWMGVWSKRSGLREVGFDPFRHLRLLQRMRHGDAAKEPPVLGVLDGLARRKPAQRAERFDLQ